MSEFFGCSHRVCSFIAVDGLFAGVVFMFGQNKRTGEANMYPKPNQDLTGWNVRSVGCSTTSIVVAADESVIAWGPSPTSGELVSYSLSLTSLYHPITKGILRISCLIDRIKPDAIYVYLINLS